MNKILAIEASGLVASCAIASEEKIIGEFSLNLKLTHSQTLLPMVDEVVKRTGTDLEEIDAIAVSGGPGSFTGLRIGSATAKGLGLALNKPIISVPTTQTIATDIFGADGLIVPLMDARREQVYTGIYRNNGEGFCVVKDQMAVSIHELTNLVNELKEPVIFLGDGVPVYKAVLDEEVRVKKAYAPINNNVQRAGSLAARAIEMFNKGLAMPATDHVPDYLRLSQAERERNEK